MHEARARLSRGPSLLPVRLLRSCDTRYSRRVKLEHEVEVKLDAPAGYVLPDLGGEPLERRVFTSTYYDTPTSSLSRSGITLRRRVENGVARWQLKLLAGEGRFELEEPGGPAAP